MQCLHAPWRMEYILSPKTPSADGSLFTRIARSDQDEEHYVIHRDKTCYVVLNRYPYVAGHVMVVPYKETSDLSELAENELGDLLKLVRTTIQVMKAVMNPDGFNVGLNLGRAAGAGVQEHLHFHVVPRWNGDTNFMPVVANATVVPEALRASAAKLRAGFQNHGMQR